MKRTVLTLTVVALFIMVGFCTTPARAQQINGDHGICGRLAE
ncbi:hypothetical protein [Candidatus Binatus sp.]